MLGCHRGRGQQAVSRPWNHGDVTDWTPVLVAGVTGITGVLGGVIGFLIARSQASVERAKIHAENERLRIQQDLSYETERRLVYHNFFDTLYRFYLAGIDSKPFESEEEFSAFLAEEDSRAVAAQLFGTEEVRRAVLALDDLLAVIVNAADVDHEKIPIAYDEHSEEWTSTAQTVIEAMRRDVAPRD
jgi:hypothetical protein